jgi:inner membrane protein
MSGTNHVTGGIVFTGIFASFWNINIFAKPEFIGLCAFFSVLADIDHLKSPVGKLFYPISKWLDRNYGHRTITHSLAFYLIFGALVAFIERIFSNEQTITLIFFFAYLSHLIFDMMTKQGVPLLYPFKRNACVIPGNPDLRFRSSDLKTESGIFVVFLLLGITCQPLFAQGFWTSYNRSFGTLKHLAREFKGSEKLMILDYDYSYSGANYKGSGFLVKADDSEAIIFEGGFIKIKDDYKVNNLLPTATEKPYRVEELFFYNIDPDSLFRLLENKPLIALKLQSLSKISYTKNNKPTVSASIDLEYVFNPKLIFIDDSLNVNYIKQLELLNYELEKLQKEELIHKGNRRSVNSRIAEINSNFSEMDNYEREKATIELKELNRKKEGLQDYSDDRGKIFLRIKHLETELEKLKNNTCNGYISYINL